MRNEPLILTLLLLILLTACSRPVAEIQELQIVHQHKYSNQEKTDSWYQLPEASCPFAWEVSEKKSTGEWSLRLRNLADRKCSSTQDYAAVLGFVFKHHPAQKLRSITTESMERFDSSGQIVTRQLEACAASKDWKDYALKYPKHSSQKSSNRILIEAIVDVPEVAALFKPYALTVKLSGVEKVFAQKKKMPGISHSLCYDAGSYDFSVQAAGGSQ